MQFSTDDDDGDFGLNNAARSRLSSLFHSESTSGDVNQALTFTAPKQPKRQDQKTEVTSNAESLKIIHVAVVHAYKLKDGNYTHHGKVGCVILGHHQSANYKCLLYKGNQVHITSCSILPNTAFQVQPNNYLNFYDEKNENWSLNFETELAYVNFCKQIALAKANSQGKNTTSLIIQDIVLGDGAAMETNDSAEIKYTGWLLSNNNIGQECDGNMKSESAYRVRLGKSKIIKGWSEGLIGIKKGGKRLLVIPPSLAYGSTGMGSVIPPDSTLIFEVHVLKVKTSRESSHSPSPLKVSENAVEKKIDIVHRGSINQDDNIRMRGASISEQLSQSPRKDKAHLISRMAKMGTATLPFQGAIAAHVESNSEEEEETLEEPIPVRTSSSQSASPKMGSKPHSRRNSGSTTIDQPMSNSSIQSNYDNSSQFQPSHHSSQVPNYSQAAMIPQQPYMAATSSFSAYPSPVVGQFPVTSQQYPMHSMAGMVPPIASNVADSHLPLLISETRTQNSELRITLSKITDKVDTVISKIDDLRYQQGKSSLSQVPYMDSSIILQNIERIVQENNQLKKDMEVKNTQLHSLNEKICDLLQRNQRFLEESNSMLEQKTDSLQAASVQSGSKQLNLEKEKEKLLFELTESLSKLKSSETELQKLRVDKTELEQKLMQYEKEMGDQEASLKEFRQQTNELTAESEALVNSLRDEVKNVEQEKNLLTTKLLNLEEKCLHIEETKTRFEKLLEGSKQKLEEFQIKSDKEMKNIKEFHEKEIEVLNSKLDKRTSSISEINSSNDNPDNQLKLLQAQLAEIIQEKEVLSSKITELKKQLNESETSQNMHKTRIQELEVELQNTLELKQKYETYYEKTRWKLKEKYEAQIVELMAEVKRYQSLASGSNSPDFSEQIKKIMNTLYKLLQGKFDLNSSYSGKEVRDATLQVIRGLTLQMLESKSRKSSSASEQGQEENNRTESITVEENNQNKPSKQPEISDSSVENRFNTINNEKLKSVVQENELLEEVSNVEIETNISSTTESDYNSETQTSFNHDSVDTTSNDEGECDNDPHFSQIVDSTTSINSENEKAVPELEKEVKPVSVDPERHDSPIIWKPQPPLFDGDDDDDDDDWFK